LSHEEKASGIDRTHKKISLARQAALLDISRSSFYYTPRENREDKKHLDMVDAIYTDYPFYGSRRIRLELLDRYGVALCREHAQRLMRLMGIEAIYPKPKTSIAHPEHKKYPYLLKNVAITHANHVWGTDITYVRLEEGWAYLVAHLDWYSRYVLSWELSLSMETDFCLTALNQALTIATPEIHNSDQGVQFTDRDYTGILTEKGIAISMDGRGRCMDNIFTERLWRTVKYENVFLKSYRTVPEAKTGLSEYFSFYNTKRRHQSLGYRTPASVYFGKS
jgi:putative transposase